VKCSVCGKAFIGQDAKSGKFAYYVCGTLTRQGTGVCTTPYLPREKFESAVVDKLNTHVLARENLEQLVKMVAEEMDAASIQWQEHLDSLDRELNEAGKRLGWLYEALKLGNWAWMTWRPGSRSCGSAKISFRLPEME
jgi:site-specific DNA recombinase